MDAFRTKAIFLWQASTVCNGDPERIAELLKGAGFEAAYIKVADGPYAFRDSGGMRLVQALHARGLAVIGWGFLYGSSPIGEGKIAASQVNALGLDGYIFDVESLFEQKANAVGNARIVTQSFKDDLRRQVPTAFCNWAYFRDPNRGTEWHPIAVAREFMKFCDYGMPMEYWQGTSGAGLYLDRSLAQWRAMTDKPIVPVGRAYNGDGGEATAPEMALFEKAAGIHGCAGISWWGLDWAWKRQDWWEALKAMHGYGNGAQTLPTPGQGSVDGGVKPPESRDIGTMLKREEWYGGAAEYQQWELATDRAVRVHVVVLKADRFEVVFDDHVAVASTTNFLFRTKCQVAINGLDGFSTKVSRRQAVTSLKGFAASRGKSFGTLGVEQTLFVSELNEFSLDKPKKIWNACSFPNLLVKDGKVQTIRKDVNDVRARTALGVSAMQDRIVLVAVDGKDYYSQEGLNFQRTAQFMRDIGCELAVMADGGGSTTLVRVGPDGKPMLVNDPCGENADGQRSVAIHMGFRLRS